MDANATGSESVARGPAGPAVLSAAWDLPPVPVRCPRCSVIFLAPDLRRESVHAQRVNCPSSECGAAIDTAYKRTLRQLDEAEKVVLDGGRAVYTKIQLFLLEVERFSLPGLIHSRRLVHARVYGVKANIAGALALGLLKEEGRFVYSLTVTGREVVQQARNRYARRAPPVDTPTSTVGEIGNMYVRRNASTFNGPCGAEVSRRVNLLVYLLIRGGNAPVREVGRDLGYETTHLRRQLHLLELAGLVRLSTPEGTAVVRACRPALATLHGPLQEAFNTLWRLWLRGGMNNVVPRDDILDESRTRSTTTEPEQTAGAAMRLLLRNLERMGWIECRTEGRLHYVAPSLAAILNQFDTTFMAVPDDLLSLGGSASKGLVEATEAIRRRTTTHGHHPSGGEGTSPLAAAGAPLTQEESQGNA